MSFSSLLKLNFRLCITASMMGVTACSSFAIEPCENYSVLGLRTPGTVRLRTEHYRAVIGDPALAAARVLPYALMSAYAYRVPTGCPDDPGNPVRVNDEDAKTINRHLLETTSGSEWKERSDLSIYNSAGPVNFGCEDNTGLMYYVWERQVGNQMRVAVAFRGTSGGKNDWVYGNMWWFTRLLPTANQYEMARVHMRQILSYYEAQAVELGMQPPRFITTGHSLGGGLAQHMLYAFPDRIEQVIAFDPTPVTASVDVSETAKKVENCSCLPEHLKHIGVNLGSEARILRVYFDYEILSSLRLPHKTFLGLLPYVQEVTFNLSGAWGPVSRHSMSKLAEAIYTASGGKTTYTQGDAWLASRYMPCTEKLRKEQVDSCKYMSGLAPIGKCPISPASE
ncbi:alpha/beta hydrolase family protein [Pseudomonas sp. 210_17 TE3656]